MQQEILARVWVCYSPPIFPGHVWSEVNLLGEILVNGSNLLLNKTSGIIVQLFRAISLNQPGLRKRLKVSI